MARLRIDGWIDGWMDGWIDAIFLSLFMIHLIYKYIYIYIYLFFWSDPPSKKVPKNLPTYPWNIHQSLTKTLRRISFYLGF